VNDSLEIQLPSPIGFRVDSSQVRGRTASPLPAERHPKFGGDEAVAAPDLGVLEFPLVALPSQAGYAPVRPAGYEDLSTVCVRRVSGECPACLP